jgi:hypothetical protein
METHHSRSNMTFILAGGPFKHKGFVNFATSHSDVDLYNTIMHRHYERAAPELVRVDQHYIGSRESSYRNRGLITEVLG